MGAGDWVLVIAVIVSLGIGIYSILQNEDMQRRQYKQSLLNDILDWIEDVSKCGFETDPDEEHTKNTLLGIIDIQSAHELWWGHKKHFQNKFREVRWRNKYISTIAVQYGRNVSDAINNLVALLDDHAKLLNKKGYGEMSRLSPSRASALVKHNLKLDEATYKAMEEVAKSKTEIIDGD